MATMKFDGVEYEIPEWARWLAQDANGAWYVFENKPYRAKSAWFRRRRRGRYGYIYITPHLPDDWTQELYRLVWI